MNPISTDINHACLVLLGSQKDREFARRTAEGREVHDFLNQWPSLVPLATTHGVLCFEVMAQGTNYSLNGLKERDRTTFGTSEHVAEY
jgi:hypothetical protein